MEKEASRRRNGLGKEWTSSFFCKFWKKDGRKENISKLLGQQTSAAATPTTAVAGFSSENKYTMSNVKYKNQD